MALSPIEIALKNARGRNDARSRPEQQSRGAERIHEAHKMATSSIARTPLLLRDSSVQTVCTAAVCFSNVQSGEARIGHRESRDLNTATFWLALGTGQL
ncbi:hypothetical protein NQZ68_000870 [Dissostichus eleginoides]|nr:hypothetical protein NQZ68_000870 [Dissostichus eleginoides]